MDTKPDEKNSWMDVVKTLGGIIALPLALFAIINQIINNFSVAFTAGLILAIAASFLFVKKKTVELVWVVVAWLSLIVIGMAVFLIWPKTITVEGIVRDTAGDPVIRERVVLTDYKGASYETHTDGTGYYQFKDIPNDAYAISVRESEIGGKPSGFFTQDQSLNFTLPKLTPTPTSTLIPTLTPTSIPTVTPAFTPAFTPTPAPLRIVDTGTRTGWRPNFEQSKSNNFLNAVGLVEGRTSGQQAIQITYDLGENGFDVITKGFDPKILSGTTGISFYYMGSGAPNSIEFKLIARYPGAKDDTTYGVIWNGVTETNGKWILVPVKYADFTCWWPNCKQYPGKLVLAYVDRLDLVVSNKPDKGDIPGSGTVVFDDIFAIQP
jgi:hypothetical protein